MPRQTLLAGFTVAAALLGGTGCASDFSLIRAHERSEQKAGERVAVIIGPETDRTGEVAIGAVAAAAIPVLIDYGVKLVEKEIKREAARYTAQYSAFGVSDAFYKPSDAVDRGKSLYTGPTPTVHFESVVVQREVMIGEGDAARSETALRLQLDRIASSDGMFFRLAPSTIEIPYSKCKLRSGDDDVDIEVRLTIDAYWIDEKGAAQVKSFALAPVIVPGVPVGPASEWTESEQVAVNAHLARTPTTWIPMIPRSVIDKDNDKYGLGTFVVRAEIKEFDDFGKRVTAVGDVVAENRDDWVKQLTKAILGEDES
ncbi:MAG: hypothetical protein ACF8QF_09655 [Phycisphaerales bacterium]